MNPNALIDAVVRQTTVFIAHLATATGVRAPLAHVANQVFVELVRELRAQGVGRKVIADMFGMALRTYHARLERLNESATDRGRTLWEAVHEFVAEKGLIGRAEVLQRFRNDDEETVKSVLTDLVETGLVFRSGRGERVVYRAASARELEDLGVQLGGDPVESEAALVWVGVNRYGPCGEDTLSQSLKLEPEVVARALERLEADGRVQRTDDARWRCDTCVIPVGATVGWEAAVFDHYQGMVTALCRKLRQGATRSRADDACGGSTYGFDVWPGHPDEKKIQALLADARKRLTTLRERVDAYNAAQGLQPDATRYVFYCGQTVVEADATPETKESP
jgi:predicted transcriptional regulator